MDKVLEKLRRTFGQGIILGQLPYDPEEFNEYLIDIHSKYAKEERTI